MSDELDLKRLRELAEQGDAEVQSILGGTYYRGYGVVQDYAEALHWLRRAADQGDADAQFALGCMYGQGQGVVQDYVQGHMWINLAVARSGDQDYADMRNALASAMTPDQMAEAQRLAREWKPKAEV